MKQNIGIDFGTTNCAVGRSTLDGGVSTQGPIPSTMAWHNGNYFFGRQARELLRSGPKDVLPIREIKRILGKSDIKVGRYESSSVDAAAQLISHVIERVGGSDEVGRAVIATPIKTTLQQREALRAAAKKAGLEDVRLVYEPTAALIGAEGERILSGYHQVLVVDWGGGTLDLSIVKVEDGAFREIAVGGDNFKLGGGEIDAEITRKLLAYNPDVAAEVERFEGGIERLTADIEEEKIEILEHLDGENGESRYIPIQWLPNEILELKPSTVYSVLRQFTEKAKQRILDVLGRGRISVEDISHVIFAGGTCNCDLVQESVMSIFKNSRSVVSANSQLLTGNGCARLSARDFEIQLSHGFGVRQADRSVCNILPGGYPITQDVYRVVELLVADVEAPHAIIELGLDSSADTPSSDAISSGDSFHALDTILLKADSISGTNCAPELIKLFVGVDRNLTVTVHARALLSGDSASKSIVGVPLAVRFK